MISIHINLCINNSYIKKKLLDDKISAQANESYQRPTSSTKRRSSNIGKTIDRVNHEKIQRQKEIINAAKSLLDNINEDI